MAESIQAQLAKLSKKINEKLGEEGLQKVADAIIKEGKKQVEEVVYDAYTPNPENPYSYKRTYGLRNDWGVDYINPTSLMVYSDRWDGDRYLAPVIITGEGYTIQGDPPYAYEYPRPFIEETVKALKENKAHVKAYKESLEDVGFKVRIK